MTAITIDLITISIGTKKLELTLEEVRELKRVLDQTLEPRIVKDTAGYGEVTKTIAEIVHLLPDGFTIPDIQETLNKRGQTYVRTSIRGSLERLKTLGKVYIHRAGAGRRPTSYRSHTP